LHLFKPRDTVRYAGKEGFGHAPVEGKNLRFAGGLIVNFNRKTKPDGEVEIEYLDAGDNPPDGVVVHYSFAGKPEDEATLTFLDSDGNVIRSFSSKKDEKKKDQTIKAEAGANRFVWNMRLPDATLIEGDEVSKTFVTGPKVAPGSYRVQLKIGDETLTENFEIIGDPRVGASREDFDAQFDLQKQIHDKVSAAHEGVGRIRAITKQIENWESRIDDEGFKEAAKDFKEKLKAVEGEIVQTKARGPKDRLKYPVMLNSKLASLQGVVASAEGRPTRQSYELYDDLAGRVDAALGRLDSLLKSDLAALNEKIGAANVTPVSVEL
jgi:hypothetical protein